MHGMSSESGSRSSFVQNPASLIAEFRTQFELQMDGPAAAPVLEMRLGVDSCTLGPFPVPRLGGAAGGAERIVLLDALMCVAQQAAGGSSCVWVRPSMRRKSAAEDDDDDLI